MKYRQFLPILNELSIPCKIANNIKNGEIEIHGFSDASEVAYGCCLYVRCTDKAGTHVSRLLCGKSKVASLKTLYLLRLELCAALLLARLATKLIPKIQLDVKRRYFWTDSTIILSWISSPSTKWKTFVAHRVSEIQCKTSYMEWRHIDTKENPADIISRGYYPSKLAETSVWWSGPQWLEMNCQDWPMFSKSTVNTNLEYVVPECKEDAICTMCTANEADIILNRYSSFNKCLRITAYCLRFKNNALAKNIKIIGPQTSKEIESAKFVLIKMVQTIGFKK